MKEIGIIGAGSWGTALAILLNENGYQVTLWCHSEKSAQKLRETRSLPEKLPGIQVPDKIRVTASMEEAVSGKEILVVVVPSACVRETAQEMKPYIQEGVIVVSASKGIEEDTLFTMSQVLEEVLPGIQSAVLSGPSHAEEVARSLPTACVVGAHSEDTAKELQSVFMSPCFRIYISPDMLGIELGGALKNVIALAAGIADGMGYGDNAKAALITRGIVEIGRLGMKMGGRLETFSGLTGIGDLIVTCASMHSRNRRAGILLGKGYSMGEAMREVNMVVEGVYSVKAAMKLAEKYDTELPIIEQVYGILFEGRDPKASVAQLMLRDNKVESSILPW
ncbi:MAG TPA: NAD(P)H-dependent glycerol-3-phosphate dehydrogenase [Candidatus Choladousia intestinigallinarum]|nr:NAD(P)H-dependent glycerol-3-phosphate dehydrogenase [Candidatus Choladousia intestinigallinarum]